MVRYVWNGDHVVHELCESANDNADAAVLPLRREKTYAFAPESLQPLAHRVTAGQSDATGDGVRAANAAWVHYLEGNAGTPELLVAGDGRILAHLDGKALGRVTYERGSATANSAYANGASTGGGYESGYDGGAATATDLRFYGHIEDPETGLFYNRYRHYDPDTGRYISPEPLGLMGGLSPFGYAANDPVGMVDPDGLAPVESSCQGNKPHTRGLGTRRASSKHEGEKNLRAAEKKNGVELHPVVANALLPNTLHGTRTPGSCGDPHAVSDYLKAYEDKHGKLDPDDKEGVRVALDSFKFRANESEGNGTARAPCRNCSQMFANMMAKYGAPNPSNIAPGKVSGGKGQKTNFQPPTKEQLKANPSLFRSYDEALKKFKRGG